MTSCKKGRGENSTHVTLIMKLLAQPYPGPSMKINLDAYLVAGGHGQHGYGQ